ncbi:MAG: NusG domain II-containing protein [Deltaproteobacteria bacterium]|nr:NusG domain II-containing protein [Deltaproteobacteria bacterium]
MLLFWIRANGNNVQVIIEADQKLVGIYDLNSSPQEITVKGTLGPAKIEIQEGRVRMISSTCPHKTCVKSGWISHQGQLICCVPNRILIRISGNENNSPLKLDGISR